MGFDCDSIDAGGRQTIPVVMQMSSFHWVIPAMKVIPIIHPKVTKKKKVIEL
jgi:hypothetical protein